MTFHGSVKGRVIVLEPGVELPEGAPVRVELEPVPGQTEAGALDPAFAIGDLAVDTGIPDLATNIDAYLYSHPRATNGG